MSDDRRERIGDSASQSLQPCELRRCVESDSDERFVCGAGGFVLGAPGQEDEQIAAICNACPIPGALQDRHACLHLRPIRVEQGESLVSFFSCRWFYDLNVRRQPQSLAEMCYGCPYWFPRPDLGIIPRYWDETDKIRNAVADPASAKRPEPLRNWKPRPPVTEGPGRVAELVRGIIVNVRRAAALLPFLRLP